MGEIDPEALAADWKRKRRQLSAWGIAAHMQEDRFNKDPDIPTLEAVHGAICMAAILRRHGVLVDLLSVDRARGIKFERWAEKKEWRIAADGSCDMLVPEGPETRRVNVGGPLV